MHVPGPADARGTQAPRARPYDNRLTTRADIPHPALGAVIILGTYIATLTQGRWPLLPHKINLKKLNTYCHRAQMFFCHRLHTILPTPFRLVGPATALIAAVRCALVTHTGAVAITSPSYAAFAARMHTWVLTLLALGANRRRYFWRDGWLPAHDARAQSRADGARGRQAHRVHAAYGAIHEVHRLSFL